MSSLARRMAIVLLAALLSLPFVGVSAQDATEETIFDNPELLTGIQFAVSRDWASTADLSTPPATGDSLVYYAGALVYEFDNEDNAEAAFRQLKDAIGTYVTEEFDLAPDEFTTENLDDDEFAVHGLIEEGDERAYFRYQVAEDDEYIFVSASAATDEAASKITDDLIEYMEDQDDDATGLGEFAEDGSSTGGLWEFFPSGDASILQGLSVSGDNIVYPEPDDAS